MVLVLQMRVGFVSRVSASDNKSHVVLGCQRFKPREIATQAGVKPAALWGSLKRIIDTIRTLPNGHLVMMRDPNEAILKFYDVPADAFKP